LAPHELCQQFAVSWLPDLAIFALSQILLEPAKQAFHGVGGHNDVFSKDALRARELSPAVVHSPMYKATVRTRQKVVRLVTVCENERSRSHMPLDLSL